MADTIATISLQEMAEQYGLLSKSPPYQGVMEARARLAALRETKVGYERMESDYADVMGYAEMVERNGQSASQALCLATLLSRFSTADNELQRVRDALAALTSGLGLLSAGEELTRTEIGRCYRQVFPADSELPKVSRVEANLQDWLRRYRVARAAAKSAVVSTPEEMRRRAWSNWEQRLAAFLNRTPPSAQTEIDTAYLCCLTEKSAPATQLSPHLNTMMVAQWSATVAASLKPLEESARDYCPLWLSACALRALGFDLGASYTAHAQLTNAEQEAMTRLQPALVRPSTTAGVPGVLVLRSTPTTVTASWKAADDVACLAVDGDELQVLLTGGRLPLAPFLESRINGIAVEAARPDELARVRAMVDSLPKELQGKSIAHLSSPGAPVQSVPSVPTNWRVVTGASGVSDLWTRGFATTTGSTPGSQQKPA